MHEKRIERLDEMMTLHQLLQAQANNSPVVGKIGLWNSQAKDFEVDLGNGFRGILPLEYASIYPTIAADGKLTAAVRSIIGKTLMLKVHSIHPTTGQITLSRVELMHEAFDLISNSIGECIECCVTAISSFGVFVDAGNGISGLIHYRDLVESRVRSFSEIVKVGQKITARIINVNENFQVSLSYKDCFKNLAFTLNPDDLIEVTILERLNQDGCFAYVNPNTAAVIDMSRDIACAYGDKVVARVKKPNPAHPERMKLAFVSFVE